MSGGMESRDRARAALEHRVPDRVPRDMDAWGGGVDTQGVLGSGSPDEVWAKVRRRIGDLPPGGGFVFASVHNVQAKVPPENVAAVWEAVEQNGRYPLAAAVANLPGGDT